MYLYHRLKSITAVFTLVFFLVSSAGAADDKDIRPVMREALDSLVYLVEQNFANRSALSSNAQSEMSERLDKLINISFQLDDHAKEHGIYFGLVVRSFMNELFSVSHYFESNMPDVAFVYLADIIEHCSTCHAGQPADGVKASQLKIENMIEFDRFDMAYRTRLMIAVRQFDKALQTWKEYLVDPLVPIGHIEVEEDLTAFLTASLRVVGDADGAINTLKRIGMRDDLPFYLQRYVAKWANDITRLKPKLETQAELPQLREWFEDGAAISAVPMDRQRLIHDIMLSRQLQTLLQSKSEELSAEAKSEIYFMMGVTELHLTRRIGAVPGAELFLEAAIRENPKGQFATNAYALLEEYALFTLGGEITADDFTGVPLRELSVLMGIDLKPIE